MPGPSWRRPGPPWLGKLGLKARIRDRVQPWTSRPVLDPRSGGDAIGRELGVRKPESNFRFRCYRTPKSDILTF